MLNRIEGTSSPTTTEARLLSTLPPFEHRGPILRRVVKMKLWNDVTCDNDVDLEDLAVYNSYQYEHMRDSLPLLYLYVLGDVLQPSEYCCPLFPLLLI